MNIEIKYNIGDVIKYRTTNTTTETAPCTFCNGSKTIQGHDNSVLPCPRCNGTGIMHLTETREGTATINQFSVNYDSGSNTVPTIIYRTPNGQFKQEDIIETVSEN